MTKNSNSEGTIIHMQDKVVFFVPHRNDTETGKEKWQRTAALMSSEKLGIDGTAGRIILLCQQSHQTQRPLFRGLFYLL